MFICECFVYEKIHELDHAFAFFWFCLRNLLGVVFFYQDNIKQFQQEAKKYEETEAVKLAKERMSFMGKVKVGDIFIQYNAMKVLLTCP